MRKNPRRRLFIDPKVQGTLLMRIVMYWFFSVVAVTLILLCWNMAEGRVQLALDSLASDWLWAEYGSVAVASLLILPVILVDVIRATNRFAGPVYRVRRSMRDLAAGQRVRPVNVRRGDQWQELAEEFNAVLAYIERLEQKAEPGAVKQAPVVRPDEELEPVEIA